MPRLRPKLVPLVLLLVIASALAPNMSSHVHAGEKLVPAEWRQAHPGPYVITLAVAVDEEWLQKFGEDAEWEARRVVEIAAGHFRPASIDIRFAGVTTWTSDDTYNIDELLEALELSHRPDGADIVVGLTAGYVGRMGGAARPRRPYVVVRHHPDHPERDAYVLAHEIGHVLGLHHHSCPDRLCFMGDHEYDRQEHWCPDHLEVLKANGGFFQYVQGAAFQA